MYKTIFITVAVLCASSFAVPTTMDDQKIIAVDTFAMKLLKEVQDSSPGKSVVVSPLSVQTLLALYSTATAGDLKKELAEKAFVGQDNDQVKQRFGSLSEELFKSNGDILTMANKIYATNKGELCPSFEETAKSFKAEVEKTDFLQSSKAADNINRWVEDKTKGKITKLVKADDITPDTVSVLLNAIYFKGSWKDKFDAQWTKKRDFHLTKDKKVQVDMMSKSGSEFKYTYNKNFKASAIEIPYSVEGFRMVIVLPDEIDGLNNLLHNLTSSGLRSILSEMPDYKSDVDVQIPKFEIRTEIDLNKELPKLGIQKLFTEPAYEFICKAPVVVSKAIQKAYIKVDEEGTEAAAATSVLTKLASALLEPAKFIADQPFLYSILKDDVVLFVGTFEN